VGEATATAAAEAAGESDDWLRSGPFDEESPQAASSRNRAGRTHRRTRLLKWFAQVNAGGSISPI